MLYWVQIANWVNVTRFLYKIWWPFYASSGEQSQHLLVDCKSQRKLFSTAPVIQRKKITIEKLTIEIRALHKLYNKQVANLQGERALQQYVRTCRFSK